jgi:glycosyltransferase involved in cell wall biosynthesis
MGTSPARDVLSSIHAPLRPAWTERVDSPPSELRGLARSRFLVRESRRYDRVVLEGSERPELLVAALVARRRHPPALVIDDATWKVGNNPIDLLTSRFGLRLLDGPHVRYGVYSTMELGSFPHTWRVDAERVVFVPYFYTLSDAQMQMATRSDGEIFAGGDSLREYGPLVEAMRGVPHRLVIATRQRKQPWMNDLPPNVHASPTSPTEYNERTAAAAAVVVPLELRGDRSAGQATYLNAMVLGKAVVVTDVAGARDYVRDGETGLIVPPRDPQALAEALRALLGDPEYARRLGAAARDDVLARFGPDRHVEQLLEVVDEAAAARAAGSPAKRGAGGLAGPAERP